MSVHVLILLYLQMESLNSSVRQLEMERNQIIDQLHLEQERRKEAQNKLNDLQSELANQSKRGEFPSLNYYSNHSCVFYNCSSAEKNTNM